MLAPLEVPVPTIVTVTLTCRPDGRRSAIEQLTAALDASLEQPDCIEANLLVDDDDAARLVCVERWASAGAHKEYQRGLVGKEAALALMDSLTEPPTTRYHTVAHRAGGAWGGPQHLELSSDDVAATTQFLGAVFGWRFVEYMPGYQGFWAPGALFGGVRAVAEPEAGPTSTPYLVVDDLDARATAVEAAGGRITVPIREIPGAGRMFWFEAPGGLPLAVWESVGG